MRAGLVSLYRLERTTLVHRDILAALASYEDIPVIRRSDRCRTRCIPADRAAELILSADLWTNRPRPRARPR